MREVRVAGYGWMSPDDAAELIAADDAARDAERKTTAPATAELIADYAARHAGEDSFWATVARAADYMASESSPADRGGRCSAHLREVADIARRIDG